MRRSLLATMALALAACDATAPDALDSAPAATADARASVAFSCEATATPLPDGSVLMTGTLSVSTSADGNPEGVVAERWILTGPPAREVSTTAEGNPEGITCRGEGTARRGRDGVEVRVRRGEIQIGDKAIALDRGTFTEAPASEFTCSGTVSTRPDGQLLFEGTLSVTTSASGNPEGVTAKRWTLSGPPANGVSTSMSGNPEGFTCEGTGTASRERGRAVVQIEAGQIYIGDIEILPLAGGTFTETRGRR